MTEFMWGLAAPVAGWVLYVERRLAQLSSIKQDTERANEKLDFLTEQLISKGLEGSGRQNPDLRINTGRGTEA